MHIQERSSRGVTILDLDGKLVTGDGDMLLRDKIRSLLFEHKRMIVLNMAGVPYVDSSGLGTICASFTTVTTAGGAIKLAHLTRKLRDLLTITKLATVFETFESEEAALASFTVPAAD